MDFYNKFTNFLKISILTFFLVFLIFYILGIFDFAEHETPHRTFGWFIEGYFLYYIISLIIFGIPIYVLSNFLSKIKYSAVIFHIIFLLYLIFRGWPCWSGYYVCRYVYELGFLHKLIVFFKNLLDLF